MSSASQPKNATGIDETNHVDGFSKSDPGNLPPERKDHGLRQDVKPPLANVPLSNFIYTLSLAALIVGLFVGVRMTQWKTSDNGQNLPLWALLTGQKPAPQAAAGADFGSIPGVGDMD